MHSILTLNHSYTAATIIKDGLLVTLILPLFLLVFNQKFKNHLFLVAIKFKKSESMKKTLPFLGEPQMFRGQFKGMGFLFHRKGNPRDYSIEKTIQTRNTRHKTVIGNIQNSTAKIEMMLILPGIQMPVSLRSGAIGARLT